MFSLAELLRPVDGVVVNAKRVLAQAFGIARSFDDDRKDRGPAFGRSELTAVVSALGPCDPKAFRGGANDAGDLDRNLGGPELGKGIVGSSIIVQRRCASIGREVIGTQPILSQDNSVGRQSSNILDEAREMKCDLRIG